MPLGRILLSVHVVALVAGVSTIHPRAQALSPCRSVPAPLELANGWRNKPFGWAPASFYKDTAGRVHLQGMIESDQRSSIIAVLPSGCRPANRVIASAPNYRNSARVDILPSGEVSYVSGGGPYPFLSLSGISFDSGGRGQPDSRNALQLADGWSDYLGSFETGYSYYGRQHVSVHGVLRGESGQIGTVVPERDRPTGRLVFTVLKGGVPARVDVLEDGAIFHVAGGGVGWLSLAGVSFAGQDDEPLPLELLNGWAPYGSDYAVPRVYQSPQGRCLLQGMVRAGEWGVIGRIPETCYPSGVLLFSANNHEDIVSLSVSPDGYIRSVFGGGNQAWLSLSGISYHPQ